MSSRAGGLSACPTGWVQGVPGGLPACGPEAPQDIRGDWLGPPPATCFLLPLPLRRPLPPPPGAGTSQWEARRRCSCSGVRGEIWGQIPSTSTPTSFLAQRVWTGTGTPSRVLGRLRLETDGEAGSPYSQGKKTGKTQREEPEGRRPSGTVLSVRNYCLRALLGSPCV